MMKVSQLNIAQSITLLAFLQHNKQHTPSHPCDVQVIHQMRPIFFHCAGVQFRCSLAHCWHFGQWTGVRMGSLTGLHLFSPIRNKLWCTVYSIYALVDVGSDHMGQLLFPVYISEGHWLPMSLSLVHPISFLGLLLIDADHCRPGTRHRSGSIGDTLTSLLSRHSSALVKLSQILTFTSFSCF